MKIPRRITYQWLKDCNACIEQRSVFCAEWPDGADLTEANLLRAAALGLDLRWLAEQILPAPLWAEFDRQRAPLWAEYERQTAPLLARLLAAEQQKEESRG